MVSMAFECFANVLGNCILRCIQCILEAKGCKLMYVSCGEKSLFHNQ